MPDTSILILVALALAFGWLMGRRDGRRQAAKKRSKAPYPSIDMLAGDRQSETMQTILSMAEREEAIELQLSLGTFYRRRGELEKAIAIHQSLFARPDLDKNLGAEVQLALATDYLNAGLYDRAERLLLELTKGSSGLKVQASEKLVRLYEEEQEWKKVLDVGTVSKEMAKSMAYACCELAEEAMSDNDWAKADKRIKQALRFDGKCIRALLIEAKLAEKEGFPRRMLISLKEILEIDPTQLVVVLPYLQEVYEARHRPEELESLLRKLWIESPMPLTLHSYAGHLAVHGNEEDAIQLLTESLIKVPTVEGFAVLLEQLIKHRESVSVDYLALVKQTLDRLRRHSDGYHCHSCGFQAEKHHWRCPSCKRWESFKPNMARANLGNAQQAIKAEAAHAR